MNRPLRIAMFVGQFPVVSETFILRQITGLLDLGHAVDIYADTRGDTEAPVHPEVARYGLLDRTTWMDAPPESIPWEMPIWPLAGRTWVPGAATSVLNAERIACALPHLLRCLVKAPRLALSVLNPGISSYRAASLSGIYRLSKLAARTGGYDVLHAQFGPTGNSFCFARALWAVPLVVSFHGYDFCTLPRKEGPGLYRHLFERADRILVNSRFTWSRLEALACPVAKLVHLPVGLDPKAFPYRARTRQPGSPVRLLTVARCVEIKGHEFVLRALAQVRQRHPEIQYDVVGDGPLRERLEGLAQELGLGHSVTFHGSLAGEAGQRVMDAAHLAVLASVSIAGDQEGQGLFLQEAQACGLPVVATQHGALAEGLVPNQSGFLVPERNPEALAERLNFLLEHPDLWPDLGRAGRALVEERFDIRALNRKLVGVYEQSIEAFCGKMPSGLSSS